jgi:hypothetical protein
MKIIRAEINDTDMFNKNELIYGVCCFYTEDRLCRYFFEINGRGATLHSNTEKYITQAIEEFLFYSGFVVSIKDRYENILFTKTCDEPYLYEIRKIQPSQFYVSESKLDNAKKWIKSYRDIFIPVVIKDGRTVSLDGHTRMKAAEELGYTSVYVYPDDYNECIFGFVNEAIKRRIHSVSDMKIVPDDEYKIKWDQFCDEFLQSQ